MSGPTTEDLLASFALLDALWSGAPVGLGFWDSELRCRRVNARLAEMDGVPEEEHLGHTLREALGAYGERLEGHFRTVLETGRPLEDVEIVDETPAAPGQLRRFLRSYSPVLASDGTVLGVGVAVVETTELHEFAGREREARARAEILARGTAALASSVHPDKVLDALVRVAVPYLADWCSVHLAHSDGRIELIAVAHPDPEREALAWELNQRYPAEPGDGGAGDVIETGERQVLVEIPDQLVDAIEDRERARIIRELELRSAAILPLRARGRVLGAMTLILAESGRRYTPELLELAEGLARQAAVALDNAQLYSEQVAVARTLQRSLLPAQLPLVPGLEVAARYRPAGRSNEVGGDFYDLFSLGGERWGFVVGDAPGKGAEAAALTALARHGLRTGSLVGEDPGADLRLLNRALLDQMEQGHFCTATHGRLRRHAATGAFELEIASGGHPAPLLLRADGTVSYVVARGPLLGVFPDPEFEVARVRLEPGDGVLLYTDGATELRGRETLEGEEELRRAVEDAVGASAAEIVETVEHRTLVLSGGEPRDDVALLALRVPPRDGAD